MQVKIYIYYEFYEKLNNDVLVQGIIDHAILEYHSSIILKITREELKHVNSEIKLFFLEF